MSGWLHNLFIFNLASFILVYFKLHVLVFFFLATLLLINCQNCHEVRHNEKNLKKPKAIIGRWLGVQLPHSFLPLCAPDSQFYITPDAFTLTTVFIFCSTYFQFFAWKQKSESGNYNKMTTISNNIHIGSHRLPYIWYTSGNLVVCI